MVGKHELLFDADVLINFISVDIGIIKEISENLGTTHIVTEVFREVDALTAKRCKKLKLHVESPTEKVIEAALGIKEPISFEDKLTLIMARERDWVCITNDKKLRKCCLKRDVKTRRGLRLFVDVVRIGAMPKSDAIIVVRDIGSINNIAASVIQKVIEMLNKLA